MCRRLIRWSTNNTNQGQVMLRIQDPIEIPALRQCPANPTLFGPKPKSYSKQHPQPRDMLLVIEVADSSLDEDLGEMAELYAQAGIKDYWVVNIPDFCVEVFRQPNAGDIWIIVPTSRAKIWLRSPFQRSICRLAVSSAVRFKRCEP